MTKKKKTKEEEAKIETESHLNEPRSVSPHPRRQTHGHLPYLYPPFVPFLLFRFVLFYFLSADGWMQYINTFHNTASYFSVFLLHFFLFFWFMFPISFHFFIGYHDRHLPLPLPFLLLPRLLARAPLPASTIFVCRAFQSCCLPCFVVSCPQLQSPDNCRRRRRLVSSSSSSSSTLCC